MIYPRTTVTSPEPAPIAGRQWSLLPVFLALALAACAPASTHQSAAPSISPLLIEGRAIAVDEVATIAVTPELLAMDSEMREFVETYTGNLRTDRQRLINLHRSIKSPGVLNMQYESGAEGVASDAFHRGTANCLSYAHMFVALAREAGLDADYQWLEVRPQWSRIGERVAVRLHVNVVVNLRRGEQYMVDIDPLQSNEVTGSRVLSDADAAALYHNNIAMDALAREKMELAWAHAARALQLAPEMPHLWVNLGAIYRLAGQHDEAERSYLYALQLNSRDRSAMNNLVVLYEIDGREEERLYWSGKVARYRDRNPYYHAWLGDKAGEIGDWSQALQHYTEALDLMPEESHLLYAMGLIHYQLEEYEQASHYISRAIETATLRRDIQNYQIQLDAVKKEQLASV